MKHYQFTTPVPKPLTPKETTIARQLLLNMGQNMTKPPEDFARQAVSFHHYNADGDYSHMSMGTKFRRYGR